MLNNAKDNCEHYTTSTTTNKTVQQNHNSKTTTVSITVTTTTATVLPQQLIHYSYFVRFMSVTSAFYCNLSLYKLIKQSEILQS